MSLPASISQHVRIVSLTQGRERNAAMARSAKSKFHCSIQSFVVATLIAAIAGGLLLYGIEATEGEPTNTALADFLAKDQWRTPLLILQALSLGIAAFCGHLASVRGFEKVWIKNRLLAEEGRLDLQRAALEIGHENSPEDFVHASDAFKDFVNSQLSYLEKAQEKSDALSGWLAVWGAIIAGASALAAAIGGLDNKTVLILIALLGVCTPALVVALRSFSDASAAKERTKLHAHTWHELNKIRGEMTAFDDAITAHDLDVALAYVENVFDVLRADHKGFAAVRGDFARNRGANGDP
ncbi:MAG: hypothetical protein ABJL99_08680 [Aliishimia sp.]